MFLKNKKNILIELDNEYHLYQHNVIYFYSKAYNTGTFLNYTKPDRVLLTIPIVKYLISQNYYNPKWTLQEFKDFILIDPEYKEHPYSDRRLYLQDITIDDIEYSEINIRYSILGGGTDKCIREMSYNIKRKSTEYLGGCFISGFMYYPPIAVADGKYCKDIDTFIQPSQYGLFY